MSGGTLDLVMNDDDEDDDELVELFAGVDHTSLGIEGIAFPPEPAMVRYVAPGSWAMLQDIRVGDTLLALNFKDVSGMGIEEFAASLTTRPLHMKFLCHGQEVELEAGSSDDQLGFEGFSLPPQKVFLKHVQDGGWASLNGLHVGDEFVSLNGKTVRNLRKEEFFALLCLRPLRPWFLMK